MNDYEQHRAKLIYNEYYKTGKWERRWNLIKERFYNWYHKGSEE